MERLVLGSGIWNLALAMPLMHPALSGALGMRIPDAFLGRLLGVLVLYTAATLVLVSRDLEGRAGILAWEGVLRYAAGVLLILEGGRIAGPMGVWLGAADLAWGTAFFVGLSRRGIPVLGALMDRARAPAW